LAENLPLTEGYITVEQDVKMANYLVTGGCGFIGSNLCDELLAIGHQVRVIDDLSTGHRHNLSSDVDLIVGDVCNSNLVKECMEGMDGCFHLAAIASVEKSVQEWIACHAVNLTGTITVFDAAAKVGVSGAVPVVYASSAAIYGDNASMPLTENELPCPLTPYGADKLACELHARVGALVHGVPSVGFRFFNVYGPRQDPALPYSGVISIFIDRVLRNESLTIFGDGKQCRDFVYVSDVVAGLIAGMKEASIRHEVFNVCTGNMVSVNQLAKTICSVANRSVDIGHTAARSGDIRNSLGDPSKLFRQLGVKANFCLGEGIKRTIASIEPQFEAA
jgi:UDP-glucose 4-epimerase